MCKSVRCKTCGQTTWSGCGAHVEQVKAHIPHDQWCPGHAGATATPASWVQRLLGQKGGTR